MYKIQKVTAIAVLMFPIILSAHPGHMDWYCKVSPFTRTYDAVGRTKAEAKLAATDKCSAEVNAMFCDKVTCEGPDEESAHDNYQYSPSTRGWICKLTPFTEKYISSGRTLANAKLKVIRMCEEKNNAMFCEKPECEEA